MVETLRFGDSNYDARIPTMEDDESESGDFTAKCVCMGFYVCSSFSTLLSCQGTSSIHFSPCKNIMYMLYIYMFFF